MVTHVACGRIVGLILLGESDTTWENHTCYHTWNLWNPSISLVLPSPGQTSASLGATCHQANFRMSFGHNMGKPCILSHPKFVKSLHWLGASYHHAKHLPHLVPPAIKPTYAHKMKLPSVINQPDTRDPQTTKVKTSFVCWLANETGEVTNIYTPLYNMNLSIHFNVILLYSNRVVALQVVGCCRFSPELRWRLGMWRNNRMVCLGCQLNKLSKNHS